MLSFLSLYNYYQDIFPLPVNPYWPGVFPKKENKLAASYIENNFKNGDGIAHTCRSTYASFLLYHKDKLEKQWVIFDNRSEDWIHWSKVYYRIRASRKIFNLEAIDIKQFVKDKKRIWLVLSGWELDTIESPEIKEWLDNNYVLLDTRKFKGIEIYLYDLNYRKNYPPDKGNLRQEEAEVDKVMNEKYGVGGD